MSTRSTPGHGVDELDAETDWPVSAHVIVGTAEDDLEGVGRGAGLEDRRLTAVDRVGREAVALSDRNFDCGAVGILIPEVRAVLAVPDRGDAAKRRGDGLGRQRRDAAREADEEDVVDTGQRDLPGPSTVPSGETVTEAPC